MTMLRAAGTTSNVFTLRGRPHRSLGPGGVPGVGGHGGAFRLAVDHQRDVVLPVLRTKDSSYAKRCGRTFDFNDFMHHSRRTCWALACSKLPRCSTSSAKVGRSVGRSSQQSNMVWYLRATIVR
ncbi:hypothetical protein EYF80_048965 [Liparis tanakae]|uniref:Uncharacterized protein n=1 Tax=Liparis tanakae TaxID=230148 RepID=A0A4Z2FIV9_9TELE|nr:hypothetical protein EYF80_048965 [Liparis tanakae]